MLKMIISTVTIFLISSHFISATSILSGGFLNTPEKATGHDLPMDMNLLEPVTDFNEDFLEDTGMSRLCLREYWLKDELVECEKHKGLHPACVGAWEGEIKLCKRFFKKSIAISICLQKNTSYVTTCKSANTTSQHLCFPRTSSLSVYKELLYQKRPVPANTAMWPCKNQDRFACLKKGRMKRCHELKPIVDEVTDNFTFPHFRSLYHPEKNTYKDSSTGDDSANKNVSELSKGQIKSKITFATNNVNGTRPESIWISTEDRKTLVNQSVTILKLDKVSREEDEHLSKAIRMYTKAAPAADDEGDEYENRDEKFNFTSEDYGDAENGNVEKGHHMKHIPYTTSPDDGDQDTEDDKTLSSQPTTTSYDDVGYSEDHADVGNGDSPLSMRNLKNPKPPCKCSIGDVDKLPPMKIPENNERRTCECGDRGERIPYPMKSNQFSYRVGAEDDKALSDSIREDIEALINASNHDEEDQGDQEDYGDEDDEEDYSDEDDEEDNGDDDGNDVDNRHSTTPGRLNKYFHMLKCEDCKIHHVMKVDEDAYEIEVYTLKSY